MDAKRRIMGNSHIAIQHYDLLSFAGFTPYPRPLTRLARVRLGFRVVLFPGKRRENHQLGFTIYQPCSFLFPMLRGRSVNNQSWKGSLYLYRMHTRHIWT